MFFLTFYNNFYRQKFGLSMGSPLSGVLASLFLEFLECGSFKNALPQESSYYK